METMIYSPDRFSKTNGWSDIYDEIVHGKCPPFVQVMYSVELKGFFSLICMILKKITGFPLNNFCENHKVKGFFKI